MKTYIQENDEAFKFLLNKHYSQNAKVNFILSPAPQTTCCLNTRQDIPEFTTEKLKEVCISLKKLGFNFSKVVLSMNSNYFDEHFSEVYKLVKSFGLAENIVVPVSSKAIIPDEVDGVTFVVNVEGELITVGDYLYQVHLNPQQLDNDIALLEYVMSKVPLNRIKVIKEYSDKWGNTAIDKLYEFYIKYDLQPLIKENINAIGCPIQNTLTIAADGKIYPCHRLIYNHLCYGELLLNGEVSGQNTELALRLKKIKPDSMPGCDCCGYKTVCGKGCLGAQYEHSKDLLLPIKQVCNVNVAELAYVTQNELYK